MYEKNTFSVRRFTRGRFGLSGRGSFESRVWFPAAAVAGNSHQRARASGGCAASMCGTASVRGAASGCRRPTRGLFRVRFQGRLPALGWSLSLSRMGTWPGLAPPLTSARVRNRFNLYSARAETQVSAFAPVPFGIMTLLFSRQCPDQSPTES